MDQMLSIDNYLSESFTTDGNSNHNNKDLINSMNDENQNFKFTYSINNRNIYRRNKAPVIIDTGLDSWQNWRLRKKILEDKKKEYERLRNAEKALQNLQLEEKEREERMRRREMLRQKNEERKLEKKKIIEEREKRLKEIYEAEMEEKRKTKEKAEEKFNKWCKDKKEADELKRLQLKEEQLKKELEGIMKKKKNEEAFKKWYDTAKNRPKSSPFGYAVSNGQFCRYYDWTTNPQPAFVNPRPWIPVDLPKETLKKKSTHKSNDRLSSSRCSTSNKNIKKPVVIQRSRSCQPTSRTPWGSRLN